MEKLNFKPINDRILAQHIYEQVETETSTSGLIMNVSGISDQDLKDPNKIKELLANKTKPTHTAKVLRVGKNVLEVKEGDTVYFNMRKTDVKHNGKDYIVFKEEDVNGIIEP